MNADEFIAVVRELPPFADLDAESLATLAAGATRERYPRGSTILFQDGPASEGLMVVEHGLVKVFMRSANEEEVVIDYRGEGEVFGFLSLVSADKSRANIVAVEDTTVFKMKRDAVLKVLDGSPPFMEYFVKSFLAKYIDKSFSEMQAKNLLYESGDKMLYTTRVGELATRRITTASRDVSIREAARIMTAANTTALILTDPGGAPAGVVTDKDLRTKVLAAGVDPDGRIDGVMTNSLITVEARDFCFEALLKMIRHNIHHLVVVDEGRLAGVVTNHDLMILQGASPLSLARDIESRSTLEEVVPVSRKMHGMITLLLKSGARAGSITRVVTEINDRLVRKIIRLAEERFGPPPVEYCWIAFGSEGRKEQTFRTDQDNALIYDDPRGLEEEAACREYFSSLTAWINDALIKCGFPPCPGDYMARNERWRQPFAVWESYFRSWIYSPTPEAMLFSVILFDFRPLWGKAVLAETLRSRLMEEVQQQQIFLKYMANMTVRVRPPLGFFGTFAVDKSGPHKNALNLKFKVLAPLINIVRLYSLEQGVGETSTLERIIALRERHGTVAEFGEELEHAFEFVSLLRIQHQFEQIAAGREPDNFINPDELSNLERRTLKEACHLISRLQDRIVKQYSPGTSM